MKLGIIGAGGIGSVHGRHAARLPGVSVFVSDHHTEKASTLASAIGGCMVETTEQLLAQVDACVVCVPTDLHAEVAVQALQAGKHVLVEKPLALNLVQCDEILGAWKAGVLAVGQVVRFFPEHRKMAELVRDGRVGKPASARLRRVGGLPRNYHAWFSEEERSGGVLLDLAVHDFDWVLWTLGPVKEVFARSVKQAHPEVEGDYALVTLKTLSGAVVHIETSWMDKAFRTSVEVNGPEGNMEFDTRHTPTVRIETGGPVQQFSPQAALDDPYSLQLQAFLAKCRGEESSIATGPEARAAVQVALAAIVSAKTGEAVFL